MPSGRRFPLAFGTYTRRTGTGCQEEIVWWTQTAISTLAVDDSATCPSTPAVLRPALRCVTCRTLTSVFDQDRSIIFCSDRTLAQSCSRVALKILRRSRPTLPSCSRQSMASQSGTSSSPFTVTVSNLPFGSEGLISISVQGLTCPRQHPCGPATRLVSGQLSPAAGGGASHNAADFLPPFGHRHSLVGHPVPPGSSALLTVGLPGSAWTPARFPRSAHPSHGRIGCPLYPETKRCSHGRSDPSGRRSPPLPGARPYRPGIHPISRSYLLRGVIKGSLAFTRPAFPLACNPRMERGLLGLAPRASHPGRQDLRRTPGRGTGIEHSPGATRPA